MIPLRSRAASRLNSYSEFVGLKLQPHERIFLSESAARQGKALSVYIREAALARAAAETTSEAASR